MGLPWVSRVLLVGKFFLSMPSSTSATSVDEGVGAFLGSASTRSNEGVAEAVNGAMFDQADHDYNFDDTDDADPLPPVVDDDPNNWYDDDTPPRPHDDDDSEVRHSSDGKSDAETDVDAVFEAAEKRLGTN